jgi:acetoin utilization protein AcuB
MLRQFRTVKAPGRIREGFRGRNERESFREDPGHHDQVVETARPDESARTVYHKFNAMGIHHIPVVDKSGNLLGILSTNDYRGLTHSAFKGDKLRPDQIFNGLLVRDLMTEIPVTLPSSADVAAAATAMLEREIHSLPIVDGGELVGIVTANDMLRALSAGKMTANDILSAMSAVK